MPTDRHSQPSLCVLRRVTRTCILDFDLNRIAYFFDYQLEGTLPDHTYLETEQFIRQWQEQWKASTRPTLTQFSSPGFLQIEDLRDSQNPGTYTFTDPLASLYVSCMEKPRTAGGLRQELHLTWAEEEIQSALDEFCKSGLMMRDGTFFLSLALPSNRGR